MENEWNTLARAKLTNVLGPQQAERVMQQALSALGIESVDSADDLYAFGQRVVQEGGFAGAVGALLSTLAVLRGASASNLPPQS